MVSTVLENGLEAELDEEFGHSKYDYRNKQIDNSPQWVQRKNHQNQFWGYGPLCSHRSQGRL